MSGAEAILVLQVISSIIGIIDGTIKIYDAAANEQGLLGTFSEVAGRLPIVESILDSAKQHITDGIIDETSCKGIKHIIQACEWKAKRLDQLFKEAIPADGASDLKRYWTAAKSYGKGNEVENLMKGILEDVQLLACDHGMRTATDAQQMQVAQAIVDVSEVASSVSINTSSTTTIAVEETEIANTLCLTDPDIVRETLKSVKGKRVEGTCEWITKNSVYQSWLNGDTNLLWISGGPGKGKTMLSIFLTEELEEKTENTILFFFSSNQDEKRNTAVAILRGLIYQIVTKNAGLVRQHVSTYFETTEKAQATLSSLETLWIIFRRLLQDPDRATTFCVLDGLDECDVDSSRILLVKLVDLLSSQKLQSAGKAFKLVIVSRKLRGLHGMAQIKLDPDNDERVASDIERFISVRVEELSDIEGFGENFRTTVQDTLLERADGTFLWIGFVMNELSQKKTCTEIREALSAMPKGLPAIYNRMLLQIEGSQRAIATKILSWVAMAVRPLKIQELATAIGIHPSAHVSQDQAIRDYVTLCGSFLKLHEDEVGFVHQSAKDYLLEKEVRQNSILEGFRIKPEKAHLELARRCLDYFHETSCSSQSLFLDYAVKHWPEHARESSSLASELLDLSLPFFRKESTLRSKWSKLYSEGWQFPPLELLHLASYFGIFAWVGMLIQRRTLKSKFRKHVDVKDTTYRRTPLSWAAENGHEAVVKLLIETNEVNLESKDITYGQTPLLWAVENGHEAVVKLLIETQKVDLDFKDKTFRRTPLLWASRSGHTAVVKLLIETQKVDLESKDHSFSQTPLLWAAKCGHIAIVKLLIETNTVNVDPKDTKYSRTPLYWAAKDGHETIVKLLIDTHKVDLNFKDTEYGQTPLSWAAGRGHEAIVKLLIETNKVDLDSKDEDGRTPLSHAAKRGHEAVVNLLIETQKVDLDCKDEDGRSPLSYAAENGQTSIVKLLKETSKVDINSRDEDGRTPLSYAAENGHSAVIKLLQ
jgi:ankyrin repeat protein